MAHYLDQVSQKRADRQATRQQTDETTGRDAMLAELRQIKSAATVADVQRKQHTERLLNATDKQGKQLHTDTMQALSEIRQTMQATQQAYEAQTKQLVHALSSLLSAVQGIDIRPQVDVKAPEVTVTVPDIHVPEPKVNVNVPKPQVDVTVPEPTVITNDIDFTPLQDTIREAMQPVVSSPVYDRFDLSRYLVQDMTDGKEVQYVGYMNPEGDWYILENQVQDNTVRYVFGRNAYTKHFKDAASYSYDYLDKAIKRATL